VYKGVGGTTEEDESEFKKKRRFEESQIKKSHISRRESPKRSLGNHDRTGTTGGSALPAMSMKFSSLIEMNKKQRGKGRKEETLGGDTRWAKESDKKNL